MKLKSFFTTIIFSLFASMIYAAQSLDETMSNTLRQSGKLYVVIAILITIFAAILIFLIRQETKIARIEKQINQNKNS